MALSIKDPETDRIVRELALVTGESMTVALRRAAQERLERERRKQGIDDPTLVEDILAIARHCRSLPVLDDRQPAARKREVFVFFINGAKERAPAAAQALLERLGWTPPADADA